MNSFRYLTALQRHEAEVKQSPAAWMPWNYQEALARHASVRWWVYLAEKDRMQLGRWDLLS